MREGQDVTERVIAEAREAVVDGSAAQDRPGAGGRGGRRGRRTPPQLDEGAGEAALADVEGAGGDPLALGVELAALLGADAPRLLAAWREVARRVRAVSRRARASRWPNGSSRAERGGGA